MSALHDQPVTAAFAGTTLGLVALEATSFFTVCLPDDALTAGGLMAGGEIVVVVAEALVPAGATVVVVTAVDVVDCGTVVDVVVLVVEVVVVVVVVVVGEQEPGSVVTPLSVIT